MISEEFVFKVAEIAHDKEALVALMADLDTEKRTIRGFMRKYSNEPKEMGGGAGPERYRRLRKLKARLGYLTEEREYVRNKIGELNRQAKLLNKASHRSLDFSQAFLAAAELELDQETFLELEAKAGVLMSAQQ